MNRMLCYVLSAILLLSLCPGMFSVVVTIGNGTDPFHYPFDDWAVYSRSQSIYKAAELSSGSGFITSLGWSYNHLGAQANAIGTTQIWLKNTSGTALTGADWETEGTLVATISNLSWTSPSRWIDFPITTFFYSGDALLVSVRTQNGNNATPNATWLYTAYPGQQLMRAGENNSSNPPATALISANRPNLRINISPSTGNPDIPVLTSPENSSTGISYTSGTTLTWTNGAYTDYVKCFLSTNQAAVSGNNESALKFTGTLTSYPTGVLTGNATYYWRIQAFNNLTGGTTNSEVWSFSTNGLPDAPILISPHNGNQNIPYANTGLQWATGAFTNNSDIYLSTNETLVTNKDTSVRIVWGGPGTYTNTGALQPVTTYYWRAVARNSDNYLTNDSPVWHFSTDGPPVAPSCIYPANDATAIPSSGSVLQWSIGAYTDNVDVYVHPDLNAVMNNNPNVRVLSASTATTYELGDLNWNSTYYWKVVARKSSTNETVSSPIWHFTTSGFLTWSETFGPVNSPAMHSWVYNTWTELGWLPCGTNYDGTVQNIHVSFHASVDINSFTVVYLRSPAGNIATVGGYELTTGDYSLDIDNFDGQTTDGTWRIWCEDSVGLGGIRVTNLQITFYYGSPVNPGLPYAPGPPDEATGAPVSGNLSWNFGGATNIYYLYLGLPGAMTQVVSNALAGSGTGSYAYSGLTAGVEYNWQVLELSATLGVTWGPIWSFTTSFTPIVSYPFNEPLESLGLPVGWQEKIVAEVGGSAPDWSFVSSGTLPACSPHTGSGMAMFNSYNAYSGSKSRLVTRAFNLAGLSDPLVSFWMYHDNSYLSNTDNIKLQVSTDGTTWVNISDPIYRAQDSAPCWTNHNADLQAYLGQTIYLGILGTSNYGNNMYIDDFSVMQNPAIISIPQSLVIFRDNQNICISWDSVANANTYRIYRSSDPYASDWGTPIATVSETVFSELIPAANNVSYFYRVIASSDVNVP